MDIGYTRYRKPTGSSDIQSRIYIKQVRSRLAGKPCEFVLLKAVEHTLQKKIQASKTRTMRRFQDDILFVSPQKLIEEQSSWTGPNNKGCQKHGSEKRRVEKINGIQLRVFYGRRSKLEGAGWNLPHPPCGTLNQQTYL